MWETYEFVPEELRGRRSPSTLKEIHVGSGTLHCIVIQFLVPVVLRIET